MTDVANSCSHGAIILIVFLKPSLSLVMNLSTRVFDQPFVDRERTEGVPKGKTIGTSIHNVGAKFKTTEGIVP